MKLESFTAELATANKMYEHYVVCLEKTPDQFALSLTSLLKKAISAYESRGPGLRHGIALDKYVTIILSQTEGELPLCGIYFNLNSPYQKQLPAKREAKKEK